MPDCETITDLLAVLAEEGPGDGWLTVRTRREEATYSRADLLARAAAFAEALAAQGLAPGDLALIALRSGLDQIAAFLGALQLGAQPAFLAPLTPKQKAAVHWRQLAQICAASRPAILVVESDQWAETRAALGAAVPFPVIDAAAVEGNAAAWSPHHPKTDDTAFLQFSSGTTGLRKAVPLSHRMVLAQIAAAQSALGLTRSHRIVSWLPLYHDMGLIACFIMPLLLGVPLVLLDPLEWTQRPVALFEAIEAHRGTHIYLPNFAFHHLALTVPPETEADLSSVSAFINCSEPCKATTFDLFLERFGPLGVEAGMLQTCYALAEAVFAVTYSSPGAPVTRHPCSDLARQPHRPTLDRELLSVGRVLPGFALEIQGSGGEPLAEGQIGEIAIEGPSVFAGYAGDDGRSQAAATPRRELAWHRTGDLGFLWQGELYVVGRLKEIVIVNGRNHFAHDLEAVVNRVAGIAPGRSVAFGVDNERSGSEDLIVLAEQRGRASPSQAKATEKAVKLALLEEFGLNPRVTVLPAATLIKTTSGKISRLENRQRYLDRQRAPLDAPAA